MLRQPQQFKACTCIIAHPLTNHFNFPIQLFTPRGVYHLVPVNRQPVLGGLPNSKTRSPSGHSKQALQAKRKQARVSIPPREPLRPLLGRLATAVDVPKFQMQAKSKPKCHTLATSNARCPTGRSEQALQAKRKQARVSIPPRDLLLPLFVGLAPAVGLPKFQMRATFQPTCH